MRGEWRRRAAERKFEEIGWAGMKSTEGAEKKTKTGEEASGEGVGEIWGG